MKNKFYITTPVYYANAEPHIGHAYTTVAADVLIRIKKMQEQETFFLTGMDEHGAKIAQKAGLENKTPQELVDGVSESFKDLWKQLGIEYNVFTRTTNTQHKNAIQRALQRLYDKGVIYKGEYEGKYCVGCEQFKTENELVDGKCPDHNTEPEKMKEESYLMKMNEKQEELIQMIERNEFKIRPERYKKEILSFLNSQKLEDISISRKNVSWGVKLPFDEEHTAYVWFDAFLSYITGLNWDGENFIDDSKGKFWPSDINLIGKDILRVHATIWPIMLMHLEMPVTKGLFVHGHLLSGGKKMSKTIGNVIGIDEMLEKFGSEATRYLLLSAGVFGEDVDITMERLTEKYNADLANGLGNLVSRVITLLNNFQFSIFNFQSVLNDKIFNDKLSDLIKELKFDQALKDIWKKVQSSNRFIEETKPWELAKQVEGQKFILSDDLVLKTKSDLGFEEVMQRLTAELYEIAELLKSFMPETSERIKKQLETGKKEILFERIKN